MSGVTRRRFLGQAGAVALAWGGMGRAYDNLGRAWAGMLDADPARGLGPLLADPRGVFDLPAGFAYTVVSSAGQTMNDGYRVPPAHDGMAAFPDPDGLIILVRNHELDREEQLDAAFGHPARFTAPDHRDRLYDLGHGTPCPAGTTTVVYDPQRRTLVRQDLSLGGTLWNCAGGSTPWGSWLSCEEIVDRMSGDLERNHGFVFEVPATADGRLHPALPLPALGRFRHEAVAVDPRTGIVYQTEDRDEGLLYRFIPTRPGNLRAGGRLQALGLWDAPSCDTRNWPNTPILGVRTVHAVRWMDVDDVMNPEDDLRARGFAQGAACFARGEGMWWGHNEVVFTATSGGSAKLGQVWRYRPSAHEGSPQEQVTPGTLELFLEPNDAGILEACDNITVSPWGDLLICEDGPGEHYLLGVTPSGTIYRLGRNAKDGSELAGACFSPAGDILFVNIYSGTTLAITGPWHELGQRRG